MKKTLEDQLKQLGLILKKLSENDITEDLILAFVEGKLNDPEKNRIQEAMLVNNELKATVSILSELVDGKHTINPPVFLHKKVVDILGLSKPCLMEIVIKKTKNILEIIDGSQHYFPERSISFAPTRGTASNDFIFKSEFENYQIICEIGLDNDQMFMQFFMEDRFGEKISNGRFIVFDEKNKIFDCVTDNTGVTERKLISPGNYLINTEINKKKLGAIKINIS